MKTNNIILVTSIIINIVLFTVYILHPEPKTIVKEVPVTVVKEVPVEKIVVKEIIKEVPVEKIVVKEIEKPRKESMSRYEIERLRHLNRRKYSARR